MDIFEEVEQIDKAEETMDVFDYAKAIIGCQIEMKAIQDDIKQIKAEAKDNGVLVKEIDGAIKEIKREMKTPKEDLELENEIKEKLMSNDDIMDSIAMTI